MGPMPRSTDHPASTGDPWVGEARCRPPWPQHDVGVRQRRAQVGSALPADRVRPARRLHALHELTVTPASAVQAQEERRWAFFITALTCSLAGQTMSLDLQSGTTARDAYGVASAIERYYCNFGLNHEHLAALVAGGLVVSGADQDGEVSFPRVCGHRA